MSLEVCAQKVKELKLDAVCIGDMNSSIQNIESVAIIISAIAVSVAAYVAIQQLTAIKKQIVNQEQGLVNQIKAAQAVAEKQIAGAAQNTSYRATLDILAQFQTNDHWREARKTFIELRDQPDGLKKHAGTQSAEAVTIRSILNQYEMIALGIRIGILDRDMYRRYYKSTIARDYLCAAEFIEIERNETGGRKPYWVEMENLVNDFKNGGMVADAQAVPSS